MTRILATVLLAACATAPPPEPRGGPRGLHATEHLAAARLHDERASQKAAWPDARSMQPGQPQHGVWYGSWDVTEDERLAKIHRASAVRIGNQVDELCAGFAATEVSVSPLRRYGTSGWNTASGVTIYLSADASPPERLLAQLRCHRAWMMLAPADMENCPLDLPGLVIDARGGAEGVTVTLSVRDRGLVPELQRRAALELESKLSTATSAP